MPMCRKGCMLSGGVLLLSAVIPLAYLSLSILNFSKTSRLRRADAAIVLGAAAWKNDPSPVFKERINHAVWLYRNGYVKKIILTGARDSRDEAPASVVARRYVLMEKIPPDDVLVETKSRTTRENLWFASRLGNEHNIHSYLVVSDPLHMKRAMMMARDLGLSAYQSPTPTTRYRSRESRLLFLGRELYFYLNYYLGRTADRED